jgi:hypothetical protein
MTAGPAVRRSCTRTVLVTLVCCAVAAGCGGGSSSSSTSSAVPKNAAQQVCASARGAAVTALKHPVSLTIADRDPTNVECRLRGSGTRLDVVAQQSAQAWAQWDTTQVHQDQAYGPSADHQPAQIPKFVNGPGVLAGWIPAQRMLFATNGTQSKGGSYVTVTVSGKRHGNAEVDLARAVTLAVLKVAPKGPNLAPPS